jgi:hypothetical protein
MPGMIRARAAMALLLATACDPSADDLEGDVELAADEAESDDDDEPQEPDALVSEPDSTAAALSISFEGPCSDASGRSGFASLTIDRSGWVRAHIYDAMYPRQPIRMGGKVSNGGSFEAIEYAPFGECTWYGLIDLEGSVAYGGWDCGQGCAGEWSLLAP